MIMSEQFYYDPHQDPEDNIDNTGEDFSDLTTVLDDLASSDNTSPIPVCHVSGDLLQHEDDTVLDPSTELDPNTEYEMVVRYQPQNTPSNHTQPGSGSCGASPSSLPAPAPVPASAEPATLAESLDNWTASQSPESLSHVVHPLTGESIPTSDIDGLIALYSQIKQQKDALYETETLLRNLFGKLAPGTTKTRRLRGVTSQIKIEFPGTKWENSILKEAWNSFPDLAVQFLKIGTVEVQGREVKKLATMTGSTDAFEMFKQMVLGAEKPATTAPTITLEAIE